MTERAYITVDRAESPRLVDVAAPGSGGADDVALQDLHDTLNSNTLPAGDPDDSLGNMDDDFLIGSEGKATLSASLDTGITGTLQNAQVAFEGNYTAAETGTATTADAAGTTLTDTAAQFVSNGVLRGAVIINFTDRSVGEVLRVISETVLEHRVLQSGTDNDWDIPDTYAIYNVIQKRVTDGNLVAVDTDGVTPIVAIFPTFCTQVIVELDTSAAQVASAGLTPSQQEIRDAQKLAPSVGVPAAGSVDELLSANPVNVANELESRTYDGVAYTDILQDLLAMASGRIVENPEGTFTIYERDNTTPRYVFERINNERVRL